MKIRITAVCVLLIVVAAGCATQKCASVQKKAANARFPQSMVGLWQANTGDTHWGIKFERDGLIKKIFHFVGGPIDIEEGGVYQEGPDPNTYMMFQMGPCKTDYDAKTKTLNASIIVDYYRMVLPGGALEGRIEDYFSGPISEDGKTWKVKWWDYGWLEGAQAPDPNIIKAHPEELIFQKSDIK
jgi:hypothetical protein